MASPQVAYVSAERLLKRTKLNPVEDVAEALDGSVESFHLLQPGNEFAPVPLVGPNLDKVRLCSWGLAISSSCGIQDRLRKFPSVMYCSLTLLKIQSHGITRELVGRQIA